MKHSAFLILLACILLLAVFGSGVLRYCTAAVTLVLACTWGLHVLLTHRRAKHAASEGAHAVPRRPSTLRGESVARVCRDYLTRSTQSVPLAFALLLLFILLSALPVPLTLSKLAGPPRAAQNEAVAVALRQARELGLDAPGGTYFSLTRNRAGTLRLALMAIAVFSSASLAAGLEERDRARCRAALVILGAAMAVAGLVSLYIKPQGNTLWWLFRTRDYLPGPLGGFRNRNHFAGLLALLVPPAMATSAAALSSRRVAKGALAAMAATVMALTVLLSLSRGATLACAAGILTTAVLLLRHRKTPAFLTLIAIAALAAAALRYLPTDAVRSRLRTLEDPVHTQSGQTRLSAWRDSAFIWKTYPVLGAGPDAFRFVYPQHRRTSAREFMTHPENEYVQLVTDTGLAGLTLSVLLLVAVVRLIRANRTPRTALAPGTAGAAAAVAVHAVFDFALHIPLYAVVAGVLVGLAAPRAMHTRHTPRVLLPVLAAALPVVTAFLLVLDLCIGLHVVDSRTRMERGTPRQLGRMLTWSPTAWQAWYHFGRQACLAGKPETARFGESCITRAAACDPNNYLVWLELGKLRLRLGDPAGARAAFARVRELRDWVKVPDVKDPDAGQTDSRPKTPGAQKPEYRNSKHETAPGV